LQRAFASVVLVACLVGCHDLDRFQVPDSRNPRRDSASGADGRRPDSRAGDLGGGDRRGSDRRASDLRASDLRATDRPAPDLTVKDRPADKAALTYSWKTGSFGACSKTCDGGTSNRSVWCERSDGVAVVDGLCGGTAPASSQTCNSQPCCTTDPLTAGKQCSGTAKVQWPSFGTNTGSAADRVLCAQACTGWATSRYASWCCQIYEDSSAGTNWVCRVYDVYGTSPTASPSYAASLGRCATP